jgi:hypothetical protein
MSRIKLTCIDNGNGYYVGDECEKTIIHCDGLGSKKSWSEHLNGVVGRRFTPHRCEGAVLPPRHSGTTKDKSSMYSR